jgi:hypothetical protein
LLRHAAGGPMSDQWNDDRERLTDSERGRAKEPDSEQVRGRASEDDVEFDDAEDLDDDDLDDEEDDDSSSTF